MSYNLERAKHLLREMISVCDRSLDHPPEPVDATTKEVLESILGMVAVHKEGCLAVLMHLEQVKV